MGLDMYLERMPRYKGVTPSQISAIESYFGWKENPDAKKYTFKKWCGVDFKDVPSKKIRDFFKPFYTTKYYYWDREHQYGRDYIIEQVGYWRKANAIHNWFVKSVQNREDDCEYHNEVTKEILEELLSICEKVILSCELVPAKIQNGTRCLAGGTFEPIYEDGYTVKDSSVAEELLPSHSGFFFGSTSYDKWYVDDIKLTAKIIKQVLETTDFETQMIYYRSSW